MVTASAQQQVICPACRRPVATWTPRGLELVNIRWGVIGGTVVTLSCGHRHPWHKGRCGREITVVLGKRNRHAEGAAVSVDVPKPLT